MSTRGTPSREALRCAEMPPGVAIPRFGHNGRTESYRITGTFTCCRHGSPNRWKAGQIPSNPGVRSAYLCLVMLVADSLEAQPY